MARKNNLNGLANNVTQSFLSTTNYQCRGFKHCGYGVDWVYSGLINTKSTSVSINILTGKIEPDAMSIPQLTGHSTILRKQIFQEVVENGIEIEDIKFVNIICKIADSHSRIICAKTEIEFHNGWIIPNKEFQEKSVTEIDFHQISLFKRIKRKLFSTE